MRLELSSYLVYASLCRAVSISARDNSAGSLDDFVISQRLLSLHGALNNIGPHGKAVPGAGSGIVVASPSKINPNYFYTWTRDSALTLKMIVDEFIWGNKALQSTIEEYIHAQAVLQTVSNPSGSFSPKGLGLGEPKYTVTGTRFNGEWGRPQRDGPALRAIALMAYSKWLIESRQAERAKTIVWPIIANDLSYVGQYWNQTGFDLWEEVSGSSFFTVQNQHRALAEGAQLARNLGMKCSGCDQAPWVLCFLQSFWNGQYITANINLNNRRTGKDVNTILGSISAFDTNADCDGLTFQPCNSKSLANFKVLMDSFRSVYAVNAGIPKNVGISAGRYPEDTYMGGNPWYLATLAAAEFLYDAVAQFRFNQHITIDSTSLQFFLDIYPSATVKTYRPGSSFSKILDSMTDYADSFVAVVRKYTPANGALSEQFSRYNGVPLSANDLTWSHASFVTMARRRSHLYPCSWGSESATSPKTCAGTSTAGVYIPALAAGAPNVTSLCTGTVRFEVNATTYYGENVYLVGNVTELGRWDIDNAMPMNAGLYSSSRPLWFAEVEMRGGEGVDYVYAREQNCGQGWILEAANRTLGVPLCGGFGIVTNDAWLGKGGVSAGC